MFFKNSYYFKKNNDTDSEFNWAAAESLSPEKQQKMTDSKVIINNLLLPQTNPPTCPQLEEHLALPPYLFL